jgi:hypothetical protein
LCLLLSLSFLQCMHLRSYACVAAALTLFSMSVTSVVYRFMHAFMHARMHVQVELYMLNVESDTFVLCCFWLLLNIRHQPRCFQVVRVLAISCICMCGCADSAAPF